MSKAPRIRGTQLVAALKRAGFILARTKGSHHVLKHADGRTSVVPVHAGEQIGPGLLARILKDCDMTIEELRKLL